MPPDIFISVYETSESNLPFLQPDLIKLDESCVTHKGKMYSRVQNKRIFRKKKLMQKYLEMQRHSDSVGRFCFPLDATVSFLLMCILVPI